MFVNIIKYIDIGLRLELYNKEINKSAKNCLVIGGNGFIGKNLVLQLLKHDYSVQVYDIATSGIKNIVSAYNNISYTEGDVNNTPYLSQLVQNVDSVVWLTHTTVPSTSMYDLEYDLASNVPPLIRFLQHISKLSQVKNFVYLSSGGTVYGDSPSHIPFDEDVVKDPISSYGLTKLISEEYITLILKNTGIRSFILRPSNVYGPYQNLVKPQGIIGHIFKSVLTKQSINIYGDGQIIRDYIHVDDLVQAILACISLNEDGNYPLIMNIGSGTPASINDIIRNISNIIGESISVNKLPQRGFDCAYNVLSVKKAKEKIDWEARIPLTEGLQDVWMWLKKEYE